MSLTEEQIQRYSRNIILEQIGGAGQEKLLASNAIWTCVSCMTCNSRCPKSVRIAEVFEALRQVLLRRREDHLFTQKLSQKTLGELPPIALIGSFRKLTS